MHLTSLVTPTLPLAHHELQQQLQWADSQQVQSVCLLFAPGLLHWQCGDVPSLRMYVCPQGQSSTKVRWQLVDKCPGLLSFWWIILQGTLYTS